MLNAWYLDGGTLVGDTLEVAKALDIIHKEGREVGLLLNTSKTELFWPHADPRSQQEDLFPSDISHPLHGVKLLGGAVSTNAGYIEELVEKRVEKTISLMQLLEGLNDPQCELALLRACMGLAKLNFALRTCQPIYLEKAKSVFDSALRRTLERITLSEGAGFGELQWRLSTLPIKCGGLGVYSASDSIQFAFLASRVQSLNLQGHVLRSCGITSLGSAFLCACDRFLAVLLDFDLGSFTAMSTAPPKPQQVLASAYFGKVTKDLEVTYSLTSRQKAVLGCLQSDHAQDFHLAIPIEGLGQHMSPVEYRSILRYRLMIPLYPLGDIYPVCHKHRLDEFGEHAIHCSTHPGFKYHHDHVRDILFDILWRAGVPAKKEAPVSFLSDPAEGRSTLRPADMLVYGWVCGKHTCVDLTGVSPLVGFGSGVFTVEQATNNAASAKIHKHEQACIKNQHAFIPFTFDTFSFLAPEAIDLLKRIQRVMNNNVMTPRNMEYVFRRIGFAIQKGLAAQLVARLPSI